MKAADRRRGPLTVFGVLVAAFLGLAGAAPAHAAPEASAVDLTKLCGLEGENAVVDEFDTGTVAWSGVCLTDGSVLRGDAANTHALNRYGALSIGNSVNDDEYVVTADEFTTTIDGASGTLTLWDDDIVLPGAATVIDAVLELTLDGSWITWKANFYEVGTLTPAPVTFRLLGDIGLQAGATTTGGPLSTQITSYNQYGSGSALIHVAYEPSTLSLVTTEWVTGVDVVYHLGIVDYTDCATNDGVRTYANSVAAALTEAGLGHSIIPTFAPDCPALSEENLTLTNGTAFDQVVTYEHNGTWDLSAGATLEVDASALPDGIQVTVTDENVANVMPTLRVHGTAAEAGTFAVPYRVHYDPLRGAESTLRLTVEPAAPTAALDLDLSVGDTFAGATVEATATGLKPGEPYTLTLRSTPVVLASGTVPASGALALNVALPAGVTAGWHSITLESTFADGSPATAVQWINLDAAGTVAALSTTPPPAVPTTPTPIAPGAADPSAQPAATGDGKLKELTRTGPSEPGIAAVGLMAGAFLLIGGVTVLIGRRFGHRPVD